MVPFCNHLVFNLMGKAFRSTVIARYIFSLHPRGVDFLEGALGSVDAFLNPALSIATIQFLWKSWSRKEKNLDHSLHSDKICLMKDSWKAFTSNSNDFWVFYCIYLFLEIEFEIFFLYFHKSFINSQKPSTFYFPMIGLSCGDRFS